jgi:NAD(P)H-hydrate epimerase
LSRAAVRALDLRASEEYGLPSALLMENAARASADCAQDLLERGRSRQRSRARPSSEARAGTDSAREREPVLVLCGPGNNGGDGMALARSLHNRAWPVRVVLAAELAALERSSADVQLQLRLLRAHGVALEPLSTVEHARALEPVLKRAPLVVDALFGTGASRALGPAHRALVRGVNEHARCVLALDLPSGLEADTGRVLGAVVRAHATISYAALKPGLLRGAGPRSAGELCVAEIGIPRALLEASA